MYGDGVDPVEDELINKTMAVHNLHVAAKRDADEIADLRAQLAEAEAALAESERVSENRIRAYQAEMNSRATWEARAMLAEATLLRFIAKDPELLEVGRLAIEAALIEFRDDRLSMPRNNGLVIRERDGKASDVIRFGPEDALRIGLLAIAKEATLPAPAAEQGKCECSPLDRTTGGGDSCVKCGKPAVPEGKKGE